MTNYIFNDRGELVPVNNGDSSYIIANGRKVLITNTATYTQCYPDVNGNLVQYTNNAVVHNQQYVMPRTCTVPLSTLISSPYNMNAGQHVYARVVCMNEIGSSKASLIGNDAIIPRPPDSCLNLHLVSRNSNSINFGWTDGLSDGGAPVLCYEISY